MGSLSAQTPASEILNDKFDIYLSTNCFVKKLRHITPVTKIFYKYNYKTINKSTALSLPSIAGKRLEIGKVCERFRSRELKEKKILVRIRDFTGLVDVST